MSEGWRRLAGTARTLDERHAPVTEKADLQSVLDRAAEGGRITPEEALDLYRSAPLHALAAGVAYSRVHTGVHYPGDVVAGSLIGVVTGAAVGRLARRLLRR